jgi:hypothetical protein
MRLQRLPCAKREGRLFRPDQRRAGVEGDPAAHRLGVVGRREVQRRRPVAERQDQRAGGGEEGAGGAAPASVRSGPGGSGPEARRERHGRRGGRVGETAIEKLRLMHPSPRTMVKNSTFVAAARAAREPALRLGLPAQGGEDRRLQRIGLPRLG